MLNIFMNKTLLSYFTYDFFWGLQFDPQKVSRENLGKVAEGLLHNPAELYAIQTFQQKIYEKNILIRAFYWIFNIGNYRVNFYKLAAFESYSGYLNKNVSDVEEEKELYKYSDTLQNSLYHEMHDAFFKLFNTNKIFNKLNRIVNKEEREIVSISKEHSKSKIETNKVPTSTVDMETFVVCEYTIIYLNFFNLKAKQDDKINWKEIESAYRKMARQTHPDKGNQAEDFHLVKAVLDQLNVFRFLTIEQRSNGDDWELRCAIISYEIKKLSNELKDMKNHILNENDRKELREIYTEYFEFVYNINGQGHIHMDDEFDFESTILAQKDELNNIPVTILNYSNKKFVLSDLVPDLSIPRSLHTPMEVIKYPERRSNFNNFLFFNETSTFSSVDEMKPRILNNY